ncbi:MAG TPA: hypothetical protein VGB30_03170 [bacterium]
MPSQKFTQSIKSLIHAIDYTILHRTCAKKYFRESPLRVSSLKARELFDRIKLPVKIIV